MKLRAGKLTASRIALALAKTKSGPAASRKNVRTELAIERLTGTCAEGFTSGPMQWGKDHEDEARAAYTFMRGCDVGQSPFVDHPTIENAGMSPDGIVDGGLLEIKCPNSATHIETLRTGQIDQKYHMQMMWQMACVPHAKWCDFVSYDPRMPEGLQIKIIRVERDDAEIEKMEAEAMVFLSEVDRLEEELRGLGCEE